MYKYNINDQRMLHPPKFPGHLHDIADMYENHHIDKLIPG